MPRSSHLLISMAAAAASLVVAGPAQALQISEGRLRGPNGANDEFVELYNDSNAALTVSTTDGSGGWAVVASDGTTRFTVPNGTVIPARGHYLGANSVGYSLGGSSAAADITYAVDIPDNFGVAVFDTANPANFAIGTRLDAFGTSSVGDTLFREGSGYAPLTPFSIDYSFYRDERPGFPKDTGSNAADFVFVDTNGTSAGAGQRLGAPGPQNLAAPVTGPGNLSVTLVDPEVSADAEPNLARPLTSSPATNATFGQVIIRRHITNLSTTPVTSLAFRVSDVTTFPSPSGVSDLRPQTSGGSGSILGTTLTGPSQPNGGGFNSLMTVPAVSPGSPLNPGESIDVQFQMGVQQDGALRFCAQAAGLPSANGLVEYVGTTNGGASPSSVCAPSYAPFALGASATPTFPDQPTGSIGASRSITFTNPAPVAVTLGRASIAEDDFLVSENGCAGRSILPGASCTVRVRFTPSAAGTRTGTLRLRSSMLPEADVALTALGTAAPVDGADGAAGADGADGIDGTDGIDGAVGPIGATGPIGSTGPAGNTGAAGATGATGATGAPGAAGSAGATGPVGNTGNAGPTGAAGNTGPAGVTGAMGPAGPAGAAAKLPCTTQRLKTGTKITCDFTGKTAVKVSGKTAVKVALKTRAGKVLAMGTTKRGIVVFRTGPKLKAGVYVVRIQNGPKLRISVS